jgi:hypothetical protein
MDGTGRENADWWRDRRPFYWRRGLFLPRVPKALDGQDRKAIRRLEGLVDEHADALARWCDGYAAVERESPDLGAYPQKEHRRYSPRLRPLAASLKDFDQAAGPLANQISDECEGAAEREADELLSDMGSRSYWLGPRPGSPPPKRRIGTEAEFPELADELEGALRSMAKHQRRHGVHPGRIYVAIAQMGPVNAARYYVGRNTSGFSAACRRLGPEHTFEAVVARERFAPLFRDDETQAVARGKLAVWGERAPRLS